MQCGAKCFTVHAEKDGETIILPVTARSSIQARKTVKLQFDGEVRIISVKAENAKR